MMKIIFSMCVFISMAAFAGPKEDFVDAVVKQCKKSAAEADSMATPGRTGTVMRFQLCTKDTFDAGAGCILNCSDKSSSIGG